VAAKQSKVGRGGHTRQEAAGRSDSSSAAKAGKNEGKKYRDNMRGDKKALSLGVQGEREAALPIKAAVGQHH